MLNRHLPAKQGHSATRGAWSVGGLIGRWLGFCAILYFLGLVVITAWSGLA